MKLLLINIIGFYAGWFACVLGAAHGMYALGPAVVLVLLLVHLKLNRPWPAELALAGVCLLLGFAVDSVLVAAGVMTLAPDFMPAGLSTFWMMCMWVNFGTTLNVSLKFLRKRVSFAVLLGVLGGPAAYYTGERLGAITVPDPFWIHLAVIGAAWGVVTPLLVAGASKLNQGVFLKPAWRGGDR